MRQFENVDNENVDIEIVDSKRSTMKMLTLENVDTRKMSTLGKCRHQEHVDNEYIDTRKCRRRHISLF